jgi:hypothetical protein
LPRLDFILLAAVVLREGERDLALEFEPLELDRELELEEEREPEPLESEPESLERGGGGDLRRLVFLVPRLLCCRSNDDA